MITKEEIKVALAAEYEKQKAAYEEENKTSKYRHSLSEGSFISNLEYANNFNLGDLNFSIVTQYGGEDMGSIYYFIHKVTRGEDSVLVQFNGCYSSYDGTEYYGQLDGFKIVEPYEVTSISYREVK